MPMPNRQIINGEPYRYAYQGQEKDPETGKEAFQLRLWDGRIGRWLSPDPYGQFHSPYLGMGNNPVNLIDKDGGCVCDNCPDNFTVGQNNCQCSTVNLDTGVRTTHLTNTNIANIASEFNSYFGADSFGALGGTYYSELSINLKTTQYDPSKLFSEKIGIVSGTLSIAEFLSRDEVIPIVDGLGPNGSLFNKGISLSKTLGKTINVLDYLSITSDVYTAFNTNSENEKRAALQSATKSSIILGISKKMPVLGIIVTGYDALYSTEEYQKVIHDTRAKVIRENTPVFLRPIPQNLEFRSSNHR